MRKRGSFFPLHQPFSGSSPSGPLSRGDASAITLQRGWMRSVPAPTVPLLHCPLHVPKQGSTFCTSPSARKAEVIPLRWEGMHTASNSSCPLLVKCRCDRGSAPQAWGKEEGMAQDDRHSRQRRAGHEAKGVNVVTSQSEHLVCYYLVLSGLVYLYIKNCSNRMTLESCLLLYSRSTDFNPHLLHHTPAM